METPIELLYQLPQLRFEAYQADITNETDQFNAWLDYLANVEVPERLLLPIECDKPAQVNMAKFTETAIADQVLALTMDTCHFEPGNFEAVVPHLTQLYHWTDYMPPAYVGRLVVNVFCNTYHYPKSIEIFLDAVFEWKWLIQNDPINETGRGQIRGMIMLLLNVLAALACATDEEANAWKVKHFGELIEPPWSLNVVDTIGTIVDQEWLFYKPPTGSKLDFLDWIDDIINPKVPAAVTSDGNQRTETDQNDRDPQSLHLGLYFEFLEKRTAIGSNVDKATLKSFIAITLNEMCDAHMTNTDDTMAGLRKTVDVLLKTVSSQSTIPDQQTFELATLKLVSATMYELLIARIGSMSPMAHFGDSELCTFVALRLIISKFKHKQPYKQAVFGDEIMVEGTGTLKLVDDSGHSYAMKALYSPLSMGKTFTVGPRPAPKQVTLLETTPAVVRYEVFLQHCRLVRRIGKSLSIYEGNNGGKLYFMIRTMLYPLRVLPKLGAMLEAWATVSEQLSLTEKKMKELGLLV